MFAYECCVLSVRQDDYSSRAVLPTVARRCVWSGTSRMRRPWSAVDGSQTYMYIRHYDARNRVVRTTVEEVTAF